MCLNTKHGAQHKNFINSSEQILHWCSIARVIFDQILCVCFLRLTCRSVKAAVSAAKGENKEAQIMLYGLLLFHCTFQAFAIHISGLWRWWNILHAHLHARCYLTPRRINLDDVKSTLDACAETGCAVRESEFKVPTSSRLALNKFFANKSSEAGRKLFNSIH